MGTRALSLLFSSLLFHEESPARVFPEVHPAQKTAIMHALIPLSKASKSLIVDDSLQSGAKTS